MNSSRFVKKTLLNMGSCRLRRFVPWVRRPSSRRTGRGKAWLTAGLAFLVVLCLNLGLGLGAETPQPPTPPDPSNTSTVGQSVTNPVTHQTTTVTALLVDPAGTPSPGATAFVETLDGYAFLVKNVGETFYNRDTPPLGFVVLTKDTGANTATVRATLADSPTLSFAPYLPQSTLNSMFQMVDDPAVPPSTISEASSTGVRVVSTGSGGANGRAGALFVPPTSGKDGADGPAVSYTNTQNISTSGRIGIEAGSIGGTGGKGGNSYASFWSGRDGGDGGAGGPVTVVNETGYQVNATGTGMHGIFAYSRSGQAGNGGSGYAAPGGGTGGHSSDGGTVSVTNLGTIGTNGDGAFGIYGLSVSNNGGNGGSQWGLVGSSGAGNYGGNGGTVGITNAGTGYIVTSGAYAHGIVAQSIGGSGGSSGTSGNLILSLNGSADNGGNGGAVSVTNAGHILTTGEYARGIFAQSVGGGGGTGGSGGGLVALGGSGSNGGSAGTVSVTNAGTGVITTQGTKSDGIFAQSVGGSGGSGSNAYGLVSVGGSGAHAGNGGAVTVENFGTISTAGNGARGIVAQSIGGGGGDGGSSAGMVSVGGSGDGGGRSDRVSVTNGGNITTLGADAQGIVAESIGGGGGNGGSSGSIGVFSGLAIGGNGSAGGSGGSVNVLLQGKDAGTASMISTSGDRSTGLFAQSVGGGGGNGGGAVQVTGGFGVAASFAIGGQGGAGGAGGQVTMTKGTGLSMVTTSGADASGVVLQSIGGGGGNGGYAVAVSASGGPASGSLSTAIGGKGSAGGAGGEVAVGTFDGTGNLVSTGFSGAIETHGDRSTGFLAQSVGGGGGNGGLAVAGAASASLGLSGSIGIGIGGSSGGGREGGKVSVGLQGNITTSGASSTGLLAQSIGGGGGNGGGAITATLAASGGTAGTIGVSVGGSGASGSQGGQVTLATRFGDITTYGENSMGILAQSIGGGGGNGGYSIAAGGSGAGAAAASVNVGLGGTAGGGGQGGAVKADLQSNVHTSSQNSGGVLVQSVGGGGGNGGYVISASVAGAGAGSGAVSVGVGGRGGSGATGGTVQVSSTGTIETAGDRSAGLVAQSIGGSGGNGGYSISAGGAGAGIGSGAVTVGLGGNGGTGSDGGSVTAGTSGKTTTKGSGSVGILAQSVGGGGGNGGFDISGSGAGSGIGSGAISLGLGGRGGSGGQGGSVSLTVRNDVATEGRNSSAVVAQTVGGGGGNGGYNIAGALSGAGIGSGAISVGLGGDGAGGGNGGLVSADVIGDISTLKENSIGILAQSVGGGGGNGGFNASAALSGAGIGSGAVSVGLGGTGGVGGDGGQAGPDPSVTLTTQGTVTTSGDRSSAILAQSIGGGGGNGGFDISAGVSGAGIGGGAISFGMGGSGNSGGSGRNVRATLASDILTTGAGSLGALVQSVGGGGGNGGFNYTGNISGAGIGSGAISVGLGGNGGSGGRGGDVDAASSGTIVTRGAGSSAFVIQSLGGGGGNGGYNVAAALSGAGIGSGAISVGLGGNGGSGNAAGYVKALSSGDVWTYGERSAGILAQSVGGGGGNGGFDVSAGLSGAGEGSGAVGVGLGGKGGAAADGGSVDLTVHNTVYTESDQSAAVIGQSIGGGGGNGGFNVSVDVSGAGTGSGAVSVGLGGSGGEGGSAGAVTVSTTGDIETHGAGSGGILAQSLGGGGGNGGFNVTVAASGAGTGSGAVSLGLGGSGAGGGNGSTVDLTVANNVTTSGRDASGIVAQSIGGGGGNGGFDVSVTGSAAGTGSGAVSVGLGGSAGTGGNAGNVSSEVAGDITTGGDASNGLLAQSVGGGGGNGGFNVSAGLSAAGTGSGAGAASVGGSGGNGGDAGQVTSVYTGNVATSGKNSGAIVAQSVGGGGGNGGMAVAGVLSAAKTGSGAASVGIGGSGGGGGDAAAVDNTVTGLIVTRESGSGGVLAQSLGGGGGNGGISVSGSVSLAGTGSGAVSIGIGGSGGDGGVSGKVTNRMTGNVFTTGSDAFGVAAQSIGGGGGNGGMNVSGTISAAKDGAGALGVGIGGTGGGGGDANDVDNTVTGYVQTLGDHATGILAQSLGGGGGNGGMNVTGVLTAAKTGSGGLAVGVGGFGGDGGNGKEVVNHVTGGVVTTGDYSAGIVAQSLGGGGGNGGLNVSGAVNLTKENGGALGVGIGGFGGGGGDAGNVASTVATTAEHAQIGTTGDHASAVVAQSIGGGGGNGGMNVTGAVNLTGKNGAAIGVGVGGFGGGAGDGGNVTLAVTGDVVTLGNDSNGLLAQSIGGGGGNGGTNITGSLAFTSSSGGSSKTVAASIGVGGFGGEGGQAGSVDVTYRGTIQAVPGTEGTGSHGLAAQSIGGGGGNGGLDVSGGLAYASGSGDAYGLIVGVGGYGGKGGDAGSVSVDAAGPSISARGSGHSAILAQSLGGGGGNGGTNVSGGIVSDSPLIVGVGGFGADAGLAGDVAVRSATNLYASADNTGKTQSSAGIMAQSLGGGGGNGALNVSGGLSIAKESSVPSITIGIGGFGGAGAASGDVTVDHTGNAVTSGSWVHGVMAQSIAGGGGNGGMNVSGEINWADSKNSGGKTDLSIVAGIGGNGGEGADAGNVAVTDNGIVVTDGDEARGVVAQSIGGGGGTGGMNVTGVFAKNSSPISVGVGGSGSGGGNAGSATIVRGGTSLASGIVSTNGVGAHAVEASSIGGGGGEAGMNFIAGVSLAGSNNTASGFEAQFAIGGSGAEGGDGGAARVTNYSDIVTQKDNSHGILSQSIGGGGGNANLNLAVTYEGKNDKNMSFNLAVGGGTGNGGDGSTSDVVSVGNIETSGKDSFGILSQSIGGGGGNTEMSMAISPFSGNGGSLGVSIGRRGGTGGIGGDVSLSSTGNVITHGDGSFGMLAQSVGAGGGNSSSTSVSASAAQENKDQPAESASLSVGLEGGVGGKAGRVDLDAQGWVITEGENAHAIFAQSIGGGGGNGGSANTFGIWNAPSLALSVGGTGGTGGTGGAVDVASSAQVRTYGDGSLGILAQSIGGGGGTGGMATSGGTRSASSGTTVSVGGDGGEGNTGGTVHVDNSGVIITDGAGSHGLLAQSLGGGGGNSGMAVNAFVWGVSDKAERLAISVGGTGGTGASAGDVTVVNTGGIGTAREKSVGIFAQSVGGTGGNSDAAITGSLTGKGGNSFSVGIGGSGGTGGTGGNVSVSNLKGAGPDSGKIITEGEASMGILAMSVGGGGGTGSTTVTLKRTSGGTGSSGPGSCNFSLGGSGGDGGTGGNVDVVNEGAILTYGKGAHGILAESVGGGGGNGGLSLSGELSLSKESAGTNCFYSVGGMGGNGNISGDVTVDNTGTIEVYGQKAYGIYAQSVGGGGGDGGAAISLSRNLLKNPKTDLKSAATNIAVGGIGGSGADSGDVQVDHSGTIISHGSDSYGIFAQSVGGGGGSFGYSLTNPAWMAVTDGGAGFINTVLGGSSKGTAGAVTVHATGDIVMLGDNSLAQFSQSVNGGGGKVDLFLDFSQQAAELDDNGVEIPPHDGTTLEKAKAWVKSKIELGANALEGAIASKIDLTQIGDLYTAGKNALGALIQSIGGGGGSDHTEIQVDSLAQVDLEMALGGKDSSGNGGGDILQLRTGDIGTSGDQSSGLGVQSIGGGGGNLTVNVSRVPAPSGLQAAAKSSEALAASDPDPGTFGLTRLGASGGTSNDGGDLDLVYSGGVSTLGKRAYGLIAQSIGGGGGKVDLSGFSGLQVDLGGQDGASGNGGDLSLSNTGSVFTRGQMAHGIVLQSIGGGGGAVLTDTDASHVEVVTHSDNTGNGGDIQLAQTGDVVVLGDQSIGILAQSLGGGGGIVDRVFADTAGGAGTSGNVSLGIDGDVLALGDQGIGILAQSRGAGGQGDISLELADGNLVYFGSDGEGVHISGGADNLFLNHGELVGKDWMRGWAVRAEEGNDLVENTGSLFGQVDLGMGANRFVNAEEGLLAPGYRFLLGDPRNLLINDGTMMPGYMGAAQHTRMTGSFTQSSTGKTFAELDFGSDVLDQIHMTGSASLAGRVDVSLLNPQVIPIGHFRKYLFLADHGVTDNGMVLTTAPSVVITYKLLYPDPYEAVLDYNVDFSPDGALGVNLREVGDYFNRIQMAGSSPALAATVVKLLYEPTLTDYRFALSQMSPDFYGEQQASLIRGSQSFGRLLEDGGRFRFGEDGRYFWMDLSREDSLHAAFDDYKKVTSVAERAALGLERDHGKWTFGAGFEHEENSASGYSGRWDANGSTNGIGLVAKYRSGSTEFAGSLSYSRSRMCTTRTGQVVDPFTTNLHRNLEAVSAMVKASRNLEFGNAYLRPRLDLGWTSLTGGQGTERNGGPTSLVLESRDEDHLWWKPSLELGSLLSLDSGSKLLFRGGLGYQHYLTGRNTCVRAGFTGSPAGVPPMEVPIELGPSWQGFVGVDLLTSGDFLTGLRYTRTLQDHYQSHQVGLKLSARF